MNNKTKLGRLVNAISMPIINQKSNEKSLVRDGECTPDICETLDGVKGAACCKLGYKCFALCNNNNCGIYSIRPLNCRVFPISEDDLLLVKNCGYSFVNQ